MAVFLRNVRGIMKPIVPLTNNFIQITLEYALPNLVQGGTGGLVASESRFWGRAPAGKLTLLWAEKMAFFGGKDLILAEGVEMLLRVYRDLI